MKFKIDFGQELIECIASQLPEDGYDELDGAAWVIVNAIRLILLRESLEYSHKHSKTKTEDKN